MHKFFFTFLIAITTLVSSSLVLAENRTEKIEPAPVEIYQAFGEKNGLIKLMDDFMPRLVANRLTGPLFVTANQERVKQQLVEQFCQALSGPCTYQGLDMKSAHARFQINKAQFNALVEELQISMDAMSIPFRAQSKLLAQLAPMYKDIITVE